MVMIRFRQYHAPYNGGEIAGFPADEASGLVGRGIASYVDAAELAAAAELPKTTSVVGPLEKAGEPVEAEKSSEPEKAEDAKHPAPHKKAGK